MDWSGSAIAFFSDLLNVLSEEGQDELIRFLTALKKSPWVGIDREQHLAELYGMVKALADDEWDYQFVEEEEVEQQCLHPSNLFIQYLNPEILILYGIKDRFNHLDVYQDAICLTKYALLIPKDSLVLPASYLFEIPFIDAFIRALAPLRDSGFLHFASPSADLSEYVEKKRAEYPDHHKLFPGYARGYDTIKKQTVKSLLWIPRVNKSAFGDITAAWRKELGNKHGIWTELLRRVRERKGSLPKTIEADIHSIPDRLGARAFIARFAEDLLPIHLEPVDRTQMDMMICRAYLESYLEEYSAAVMVDTPLGGLDCDIPLVSKYGYIQRVSLRNLKAALQSAGLRQLIEHALSWAELLVLRDEFAFRWIIDQVVLDLIDPQQSFQQAVLKSGYRTNSYRIRIDGRRPLDQARDTAWNFFQLVHPVLSDFRLTTMSDGSKYSRLKIKQPVRQRQRSSQLKLFSD